MNTIVVTAYSEVSNNAILTTPGRNHPGCVVQGDELRSMLRSIQRAVLLLDHEQYADAKDEIKDVEYQLFERCKFYEQVMRANELGLPYPDEILAK